MDNKLLLEAFLVIPALALQVVFIAKILKLYGWF